MLLYRWRRRVFAAGIRKKRERGRIVGIDIDGVLGDQISEILRRVGRRYGEWLSYDDVTDWRLPIADTNIADLIEEAMGDPEYVLGMKAHPSAWVCVRKLYQSGRLFIVTARPASADEPTRQWLDYKRIPYDGIVHAKEAKKHIYSFDVLVDDYIGNVKAFLANSNGAAILVDQPWNRDRGEISTYIDEGRLGIAERLEQVPDLVQTLNVGPRDVARV